jgi:tRNA-dihydrouridine synthase
LGNGDLKDMGDVYHRVRQSGVDGVLLGRAAQGNPWIFRAKHRLKRALGSVDSLPIQSQPVDLDERFRVIVEHAQQFENYVQIRNFVGMRKHLIWYCRDFSGAAELRAKMARVNNTAQVIQCLREFRHWPSGQAGFAPPPILWHDGQRNEAMTAAF